jgi:hypothetical protein
MIILYQNLSTKKFPELVKTCYSFLYNKFYNSVADPDPHQSGKLDPDQPQSQKQDPEPELDRSQNQRAADGGLKRSRGGPKTLTMEA